MRNLLTSLLMIELYIVHTTFVFLNTAGVMPNASLKIFGDG